MTNSSERCTSSQRTSARASDVAGPGGRHGNVGEPEDPVRVVVPHVARHLAGARRRADQAELEALLPRYGTDALEASLHRGVLEQEIGPPGAALGQHAASRARISSAIPAGMSNSTPPGRTRPRPKRLPESVIRRFRKSPRIRPKYAAAGRYPTSPASAPRSPMWLARRSSSRAMPRMACALGVLRLRASASMAPQCGARMADDVSPASVSATRTRVRPPARSSRRSTPRC